MRTSMNLPDGLLEQARARAVAEGSTVTALVIEGLRARLASDGNGGAGTSVILPSRSLGRAAIDMSDNRAVRAVLDADEDNAFRDRS